MEGAFGSTRSTLPTSDIRARVAGATWGRRLFPPSFDTATWCQQGELKRWEEAYPAATASPVEGLDCPYDGMASMDTIEAHCATVEPRTLQRALTYLNHFNPGFKMAVVGRIEGRP